jgi:hypothetical protein
VLTLPLSALTPPATIVATDGVLPIGGLALTSEDCEVSTARAGDDCEAVVVDLLPLPGATAAVAVAINDQWSAGAKLWTTRRHRHGDDGR